MQQSSRIAERLALALWAEAAGRPVRALEALEALAVLAMRQARAAGPMPLRLVPAIPAADDPRFEICRRIAARAAAGMLGDATGGATHWHGVETLPRWALGRVPTAEIGGVVFYKVEGPRPLNFPAGGW
jgi:hypothetical protein